MKRGNVMKSVYLIAILAVVASTASAAPYWGTDVDGATYQEWNFIDDDTTPAADVVDNDYATGPIIGNIKGSPVDTPSWQNGIWSGNLVTFTANVPNTNITTPDSYKDVVVEVGYRGKFQLSYVRTVTGEYFQATGTEFDTYLVDNDVWTIRRDYYHIEPNPTEEYFCYGLNEFGAIQELDYINISTRCVPEPATMCLLALGGLVIRRRSAKKA